MKIKTMVKSTESSDLGGTSPTIGDISVQRLIDDSLLALSREVRNLLTLSSRGKLEASDARDLRDHLKLLFELKDRENESLRGVTDEQLKALLDEQHRQDGSNSGGSEAQGSQQD